jgi:hypothetical protein
MDFLAARKALLHVREAFASKEMDSLTRRMGFSGKEKGSQLHQNGLGVAGIGLLGFARRDFLKDHRKFHWDCGCRRTGQW